MKLVILTFFVLCCSVTAEQDERLPNKCEVCKFLSVELQDALEKSGRSKEVLELGEVLDSGRRRRKIKYYTSETRLTEALDNICERVLQYNVHAERPGSLRYAKEASQDHDDSEEPGPTRGQVDLGLPFELWDEPSVECETMLEQYEEVVEDWYFNHQEKRLESFLCQNQVLKTSEQECIKEMWKGDMRIKSEAKEAESHGAEEERKSHDAGEL
ncbi:hypothetical protein KUCAC02_000575 [Chaenocephalus aceratus]|uniref:Uncharacterized protein n=1 Tax=Chaenocephalus aceratus TaxID=36190 RepID=A0ACB9W6X3_CHAAC|nr:hypothetical protein KUCAC02_000575 [Chaenocephalus aceratus]